MEEDFKSELEWAEERLGDLVKFSQGEEFKKLLAEDRDLIVQQASALNSYNEVLKIRAKRAKK
ncbi:MAG TPA: hypothetical protein PKV43_03725 [Armatimonadota bacterium]|nr:hypothetical protein [Armatimonadota bacterium]